MTLNEGMWLWRLSKPIFANEGMQKQSVGTLRILKRRLDYVVKGLSLRKHLNAFKHPRKNGVLQRTLQQRPEILGAVVWPYICASWPAGTRLQHMHEHFEALESMGGVLDFPPRGELLLLDLGDVAPNLRVVLDQAEWFVREGMLVLNLFLQDVRIYSLAFSFAYEESKLIAYVGAIQGVDVAGIMNDYKDLTKALHGMRPRDFQVEVFRIFCRACNTRKIYAICDDKRQHRSSYFDSAKSEALFLNYNAIWEERGGVKECEDFYTLALETPMKNLEEVPSKKRGMYRRRYEMLQAIEARVHTFLQDQRPGST